MTYYGYNNKSTKMNDWIRMCCKPPKEGLLVSDLDFIFFDFKKRRMKLIEVKTYNAKIKDWQRRLYKRIDSALKNKKHECGDYFEYEGFFLIVLSDETPETSDTITINNIKTTKEQLIKFLDFEIYFDKIAEDEATDKA